MSRSGAAHAAALWVTGPGTAEIRAETLPALAPGQLGARALYSGISRGTERLVWRGQVPASERERMRCPHQAGDFPWPVKYGYSWVGETDEGQRVFCLHPHQDRIHVAREALQPIPAGVPARRAVLAANMETALNAIWDARATAGQSIRVIGGGVVGMLVAYLAARLPGAEVQLVDRQADRGPVAARLGVPFALPAAATPAADLVLHASGHADGLELALSLAGEEATLVELSWYGERPVAVPLGHAFHPRRLRLLSSQVGTVAPCQRPRWDAGRRLRLALELLADPALEALLEPDIDFHALPAMAALFAGHGGTPVVAYPPPGEAAARGGLNR
ncbi:MAG: zinc-binding alcohol dehydrogenase [Pseudomonadota bacterium]|nr:zinc-binding alcohol dehydrogenase [Pseudomonadota bacterium]